MSSSDPIRHVVLLMMENHSFDQMLGALNGVYPDLDGVDAAHVNMDRNGKAYHQAPTDEVQTKNDPMHEFRFVKEQLADNNGGFIRDYVANYPDSTEDDRQQIMGYYALDKLPALHALGRDFTVCDRWFSSVPGPTWPNRFFALSGTSMGRVLAPEGRKAPRLNEYFAQTQETVFDQIRKAGRRSTVYFYDFPASWLLLRQLEPDNLMRYKTINHLFTDVRGDEADFADFAFIEPKYFGQDQNDDHPPHNVMKAEKLIADVYNAIRSNPELWQSTLLVVAYDEHGGFYDHVPPPATIAPDAHVGIEEGFRFDRLGIRVPALLISPYVKRGVEHAQFDHTSLLRYLTEKWGLGPLGARTASANSISVAIGSEARTDTIPFIRVPYTDLIAPHPEWEKDDEAPHHKALHAFGYYLAQRYGDTYSGEGPGVLRRFVFWMGCLLIRIGEMMAKPKRDAQKSQARGMQNVVERIRNGAQRVDR
jgi:phospholipase C